VDWHDQGSNFMGQVQKWHDEQGCFRAATGVAPRQRIAQASKQSFELVTVHGFDQKLLITESP
jgi:hypothetical protein